MTNNYQEIFAQEDLDNSILGLPTPEKTPIEDDDFFGKAGTLATSRDSKLEGLARSSATKATRGTQIAADIRGIDQSKYKVGILDEVVDGDTLKLQGEVDSLRFGGSPKYGPKDPKGWIDTPETYHGKFSEQPKEVARVAKQQSALGLKSPTEVYQAGELSKLDAMYTLMGRPKDAKGKEWTPGPITYDPTKVGSIELGSEQNPLGLGIKVYQTGAHTKDGRGLGYFEDKSGTQNLNARIADQGLLSVPNAANRTISGKDLWSMSAEERTEKMNPRGTKRPFKESGDVISGYNVHGSGKGDYAQDVNFSKRMHDKVSNLGGEGALSTPESIQKALTRSSRGDLSPRDIVSLTNSIYKQAVSSRMDPTLLVASVLHETTALSSPVFRKNNNLGGVTWTKAMEGQPGVEKGSPRPASEGGNYVKFTSWDSAIAHQVKAWEKQRVHDLGGNFNEWLDLAGGQSPKNSNWIDTAQYGVGRFLAGTADAVVDTGIAAGKEFYKASNTLHGKYESPEKVDKVFASSIKGTVFDNYFDKTGDFKGLEKYTQAAAYGYDNADVKQATANFAAAAKTKDPMTMVKSLITAVPLAGPEFVLESAGEFLSGPLGWAGVALNGLRYTNDILADRKEITGRPATPQEAALVAVAGTAEGLLNKLGFDEIVGNTKLVKSALRVVADMGSERAAKGALLMIAGKLLNKGATVVGKGIYEGGEEVLQEGLEIIGSKYGTVAQNEILSDKTFQQLFQAYGGGHVAGSTISAVQEAKDTVLTSDVRDKMIKAIEERRSAQAAGKSATAMTDNYVKEASAYTADMATERATHEEMVADIAKYEEDITNLRAAGKLDAAVSKAYESKKASVMQEFANIRMDVEDSIPTFGSSRKALNYLSLVLDNQKMDADTEAKIDKIAAKNGVKAEDLRFIKDMVTVEQEATEGKRGYNTYSRKLDNLMKEPEVNEKKIRETVSKMERYRIAEVEYAKAVEGLISKAKIHMATGEQARKINAAEAKVEQFPVTIPAGEFRSKPKTISIYTSEAGIAAMQKILDKKYQNIEGINAGLRLTGTELKDLGIETEAFTGKGVVIPQADEAKTKAFRKLDEDTYTKHGVTKVILGKTATKKWAEYNKLVHNKDLVNTGKYTKDDVVVINALTYGNKGAGKELINEIKKAKKAGATIVLDTDMKGEARKFIIRQLTQDFGSGVKYIHTAANGNVFKPAEVASKENKEVKETADKTEAEKSAKAKVNGALVLKWAELYETHEGDEEAIVKDMKIAEEMSKAYENFTGSETKTAEERMLEFAKNAFNKQVNRLGAHYYKVMLANEGSVLLENIGDTEVTSAVMRRVAMGKAEAKFEKMSETEDILKEWKAATDEMYKLELKDSKFNKEAFMQEQLEKFGVDKFFAMNNLLANSSSLHIKEELGTTAVYVGFDAKDKRHTSTKFKDGYKQLKMITSDIVKAVKATPLNSLEAEQLGTGMGLLIEEALDSLVGTAKSPGILDLTISKEHTSKTMSRYAWASIDSPARGLLISNIDGKDVVNKNVAAAMMIALHEQVKVNSYMLSAKAKSKQDVANAHGVQEFALDRRATKELGEKGMLRKTVANDLGRSTAQLLGLSAASTSDIDKEQYDMLIADLGNIAVLVGVDKNLLELSDMPVEQYLKLLGKDKIEITLSAEDADVGFVSIPKGAFVEGGLVEEYQEVYDEITSWLPEANTKRAEYKFAPISKARRDIRANSIAKDKSGFVPAKEAAKTLDNLMNQAYVPQPELIKYVLENKETVMTAMGYREIAEDEFPADLTAYERDTQIAQNRDIGKSIEELQILMDRAEGKEAELYFEWFYTKNRRYMMDSNTINPQTDKQLHRSLVVPKEHMSTYTMKNGKFIEEGVKGEEDRDVTKAMHYSLAQAFDIAVDKDVTRTTDVNGKDVTGFIDKMEALVREVSANKKLDISAIREALLTTGKAEIGGIHLEVEHVGHVLQALDVLEQIKAGGKVKTAISAEFDALTSGFGIKLTQMPILKNTIRYMLKVGIVPKVLLNKELRDAYVAADETFMKDHEKLLAYLEGTDPSDYSMNDILNTITDSYQTLATKMVGIDEKLLVRGLKENKSLPQALSISSNLGTTKKVWKAVSALLPVHIEGEAVSKALRTMFKSPFMTFNYSASIKSIKAALASEIVGNLMKDMLSEKGEALALELLRTAGAKTTLAEFRSMISTHDASTIRLGPKGSQVKVLDYLETMVNASYGTKVEDIMTAEFAPFIEVQDAVNLSFKAMFQVYNVALQQKLKEVGAKGFISKEDEISINKELRDKFPAIRGPLADAEEESKLGIYDTKTGSPSGKVASQTWMNKAWAKSKGMVSGRTPTEGQQTLKVWHKVKIFTEAISAGSVIPIHYIDGAVMGKVINAMTELYGTSGILAIHDAIIAKLGMANEVVEGYNENWISTTGEYNVIEALFEAMSKVNKEISGSAAKDFDKLVDVYIDGKSEKMQIRDFVDKAFIMLKTQHNKVQKGLADYKELMSHGAYVMHMVGMSEGVYDYEGTPKAKVKQEVKAEAKSKEDIISEIETIIASNSTGKVDKAFFNKMLNQAITKCKA